VLVAFGSMIPIIGQMLAPAALLVRFGERQEEPSLRYLPAVLGAALVSILVPPFAIYGASVAVAGMLLDQAVRRSWDWRAASLLAAVPLVAGLAIPIMGSGSEFIRGQLMEAMEPVIPAFSSAGFDPAQAEETVRRFVEIYMRLLPGMFALTGLFYGVFALAGGSWWLRRKGAIPAVEVPQLAMWVVPERMIWLTAASLVLSIFTRGEIQSVGLNLTLVLAFLYSIQGLAIMWYGFITRAIPAWARVLLVIVVLLFPPAIFPMLIVGILETWVPFRSMIAAGTGDGDEEEF
jgi:hypothetical protein